MHQCKFSIYYNSGRLAQLPPKADPPTAGVSSKNMYNVYVLKSLKNGKQYIGSTGKDVNIRLKEHNQGSNKWTKANNPFRLMYTENFVTITEARKRENFLKSGVGRKQLKEMLSS